MVYLSPFLADVADKPNHHRAAVPALPVHGGAILRRAHCGGSQRMQYVLDRFAAEIRAALAAIPVSKSFSPLYEPKAVVTC